MYVDVEDMSVAITGTRSENLIRYTSPEKASAEFGILLANILKELEKDESNNLMLLKIMSSTLTIKNNSDIHVFTDKQLEEIQACNNIQPLLMNKLRHCYRWDDHSMLTVLMSSINSEKCVNLLETFKVKIDGQIKLQQIYEHCKQTECCFSEEYHKMVAIINKKFFFTITKEEYEKLKYFVSEQCGVEAYVVSPLSKASSSSLILEWYIPCTAVAHMIKLALKNKSAFIKRSFVYVKISSTIVLDYADIVSDFIVYNCTYVCICTCVRV